MNTESDTSSSTSDSDSDADLPHGIEPDDVQWSGAAGSRAVRALARHEEGLPLSRNKGVTCSQFVGYTYQAAAVEHALGGPEGAGLQAAVDQSRERERERQSPASPAARPSGVSSRQQRHERRMQRRDAHKSVLSPAQSETVRDAIPKPLGVEVKRISFEWMENSMSIPERSDFQKVGHAVYDGDRVRLQDDLADPGSPRRSDDER